MSNPIKEFFETGIPPRTQEVALLFPEIELDISSDECGIVIKKKSRSAYFLFNKKGKITIIIHPPINPRIGVVVSYKEFKKIQKELINFLYLGIKKVPTLQKWNFAERVQI